MNEKRNYSVQWTYSANCLFLDQTCDCGTIYTGKIPIMVFLTLILKFFRVIFETLKFSKKICETQKHQHVVIFKDITGFSTRYNELMLLQEKFSNRCNLWRVVLYRVPDPKGGGGSFLRGGSSRKAKS